MKATKITGSKGRFLKVSAKADRKGRVIKTFKGEYSGSAIALVAALSPQSIRQGVDYKLVESLAERGITRKELIGATKIPSATLDRRKKSGRLNPVESDKVYRLITILEAAERLFKGDGDKALSWCRKPARGLDGQVPLELSDTTAGQDIVMDYIGRIEHGIPT